MSARRPQSGLSLIEVLIATVILALGLLGIAGLQMSGVQSNYYAYQATQASVLAQNLAERMRANRLGVLDGRYLLAVGNAPSDAFEKDCAAEGETCNSEELAAWDMAIWYSMIAPDTAYENIPAGPTALLPGGQASIECLGACGTQAVRLITIYWDADRNGATGTTCGSARTDLKCFRLAFVP